MFQERIKMMKEEFIQEKEAIKKLIIKFLSIGAAKGALLISHKIGLQK